MLAIYPLIAEAGVDKQSASNANCEMVSAVSSLRCRICRVTTRHSACRIAVSAASGQEVADFRFGGICHHFGCDISC